VIKNMLHNVNSNTINVNRYEIYETCTQPANDMFQKCSYLGKLNRRPHIRESTSRKNFPWYLCSEQTRRRVDIYTHFRLVQ